MMMRDGARMWAAGAFDGGGSRDSGYLPAPGGRWRMAKPLRGGCSAVRCVHCAPERHRFTLPWCLGIRRAQLYSTDMYTYIVYIAVQ